MRLKKPLEEYTEKEVKENCEEYHKIHEEYFGNKLDCTKGISYAQCHFVKHKACPMKKGNL